MKILQIGVPKSGNLWLYKILCQLQKLSGNLSESYIQQQPIYRLAKKWELNYPDQAKIDIIDITDLGISCRISSIYKMPMDNLSAYFQKTSHVWTHSPVCKNSEEVFSFFDKKVYIIRDPRDVLVSASKYYTSPYMLKFFPQEETEPQKFLDKNFDSLLHNWVWHVWDYLRLQPRNKLHICYYEGFLQDFQNELALLLQYFNLKFSVSNREKLQERVSFSRMKEKNPRHLNKGTSGQWKGKLSTSQQDKILNIAGPILKELGYIEENRSRPRDFSQVDFSELKDDIISGMKNV